jgi:hypothetical protein
MHKEITVKKYQQVQIILKHVCAKFRDFKFMVSPKTEPNFDTVDVVKITSPYPK